MTYRLHNNKTYEAHTLIHTLQNVLPSLWGCSGGKTLTTSALGFLVGVVEDKFGTHFVADKIHLCAYEKHNGLGIHNDLHTVVGFNHLVEFVDFVSVVHGVGHTIATAGAKSYAHADRVGVVPRTHEIT